MDISLLFISSISGFCSFVMSLVTFSKINNFFKSAGDLPYYSLPAGESSSAIIDPSTTITQLNKVQVDPSTVIEISKPIQIPPREVLLSGNPRLRTY